MYQVREFPAKTLFKVSEKSRNFILRWPQIILLHVFVYIDKAIFGDCFNPTPAGERLGWTREAQFRRSLFLLIHGQNSHLAGPVKIALQSVKSQGKVRYFVLVDGNPDFQLSQPIFYPGPRSFLVSLIGKFCDANRFF